MQQLEDRAEFTEHRPTPPYISYATFVTFLDWLKDMPAIPSQIDRSLWQGKFAGSTGAQLMAGLRFLGLLDGDRPQSELQRLVNADKSERKSLIKNLLHKAYGADLVNNLATMTPKMLNDRISGLGTSTTTHKKAVSFFVNAARENDVTVPPSIGKQARNRQPKLRTIRQKGEKGTQGDSSTVIPRGGNGSGTGKGQNDNGGQVKFNLHMAVVAMLQDLEKLVPDWSKTERGRWLKTFEITLDYAYPPSDNDEGGE